MKSFILALFLTACQLQPAGLTPTDADPPLDTSDDAMRWPCGRPCAPQGLCVLVNGVPGCYPFCHGPADCVQGCCVPLDGTHASVCVDTILSCSADGGVP